MKPLRRRGTKPSAKISCAYKLKTTKFNRNAVICLSKWSLHPRTRVEKDPELKVTIIIIFTKNGTHMDQKWSQNEGPGGSKTDIFPKRDQKGTRLETKMQLPNDAHPFLENLGKKGTPRGTPKSTLEGHFSYFWGPRGVPRPTFYQTCKKTESRHIFDKFWMKNVVNNRGKLTKEL